MIDTLIVVKNNHYGLTRDAELLADAIREFGVSVEVVGISERKLVDRLVGRKLARRAVHIERVFPQWLSAAQENFLIPNQERFPRRHLAPAAPLRPYPYQDDGSLRRFRRTGSADRVPGFHLRRPFRSCSRAKLEQGSPSCGRKHPQGHGGRDQSFGTVIPSGPNSCLSRSARTRRPALPTTSS